MYGQEQFVYVPQNAEEKPQRVLNQATNKYEDECDFDFDNLNTKKQVELRRYKGGPKHRIVHDGLSLEGTCNNKQCKVHLKRVWVKKDFGKIQVGEARFKCFCPECGKKLPSNSVTNLGYRNASVRIEGIRRVGDDEEEPFLLEDTESKGKFIKFEHFDQNICTWGYICIDCQPVEKVKNISPYSS